MLKMVMLESPAAVIINSLCCLHRKQNIHGKQAAAMSSRQDGTLHQLAQAL